MPIEIISYMLSDEDEERRVQSQLVLQCAPFLKGIKVSAVTNIDRKYIRALRPTLEGTGISFRILAVRKKNCLVFFYREGEFTRYLERAEIREFLVRYGYDMFEAAAVLQRLAGRVSLYSKEEIAFPHEIGVFLDYPIADVKGFIRNEGKGYLMSGYWKVYHNLEAARKLFQAYDQAKVYAVQEFLDGKLIRDIAVRAA